MTQLVHLKNFLQVIDMSTHFSAASICLALPKRIELEYYTFFNERKLVLGLQHVKVKVKVKTEKFRNIGVLPYSLDDLRYCKKILDIE